MARPANRRPVRVPRSLSEAATTALLALSRELADARDEDQVT